MKLFRISWWHIIMALLIGASIWYFSNIVAYILISFVFSLMGQPLVRLLDKVKLKTFQMPHTLSTILTLFVLWGLIIGLFLVFVPLISYEAKALSQVNWDSIQNSLHEPLNDLQNQLLNLGIINPGDHIETQLSQKAAELFSFADFSNMFKLVMGLTGNLLMGFFSVSFITFFFLKDDKLFHRSIMAITPIEYQTEVSHILVSCRKLLSRYFLGLCLDISLVIALICIGMALIGVKNFILVGFLAGIMNIVPYIGPIIGATIGVILGITGFLNEDFHAVILPLILKMLGVFAGVNLLDAILIQPTIYSNSVKAHPLEIFIVIMIAGSLAGVMGMILAIPTYTLLRIVAKEFFSGMQLVKKLTRNL